MNNKKKKLVTTNTLSHRLHQIVVSHVTSFQSILEPYHQFHVLLISMHTKLVLVCVFVCVSMYISCTTDVLTVFIVTFVRWSCSIYCNSATLIIFIATTTTTTVRYHSHTDKYYFERSSNGHNPLWAAFAQDS